MLTTLCPSSLRHRIGILSPWVFGFVIDRSRGEPLRPEMMAWGLAWPALGMGAVFGPLMTVMVRQTPEACQTACGKR